VATLEKVPKLGIPAVTEGRVPRGRWLGIIGSNIEIPMLLLLLLWLVLLFGKIGFSDKGSKSVVPVLLDDKLELVVLNIELVVELFVMLVLLVRDVLLNEGVEEEGK